MDTFYLATASMAGFMCICSCLPAPKKNDPPTIRDVQGMIAVTLFGIVSLYGLINLID